MYLIFLSGPQYPAPSIFFLSFLAQFSFYSEIHYIIHQDNTNHIIFYPVYGVVVQYIKSGFDIAPDNSMMRLVD